MVGVAFVGFVRVPTSAIALLCLARVRAPDALGHGHHDVVGSLQTQRGGDGGRHGGHVRQRRCPGLLLLMGTLVATVGYTPFFVGLAVLDLIGALILWTVVREPVISPATATERAAIA